MGHSLLDPNQWINLYADALYTYTLPRVSDSALAEDIVQETFLSAWKAWDTFKGEASEKSWLYSICKNKIIDHYRKKGRDIVQPMSEISETDQYFDESEHWTKLDGPGEWGIDYQDKLETNEFYSVLNGCKKKLQDLQQSVFSDERRPIRFYSRTILIISNSTLSSSILEFLRKIWNSSFVVK